MIEHMNKKHKFIQLPFCLLPTASLSNKILQKFLFFLFLPSYVQQKLLLLQLYCRDILIRSLLDYKSGLCINPTAIIIIN